MKLRCQILLFCTIFSVFSCSKKKTEANEDREISLIASISNTSKKFLFDASKAETAGNADWILDADKFP